MNTLRFVLASTLSAICFGCKGDEPAAGTAQGATGRDTAHAVPLDKGATTIPHPAPAAAGENSTEVAEIVRAAIAAHGGEANFAKTEVARMKLELDGSFAPGVTGKFTMTEVYQMPDKHKRIVDGDAGGLPFRMHYVRIGDQAWVRMNGGETRSLPAVSPQRGTFLTENFAGLSAMQGPDLQLTLLGTAEIGGHPAFRVRVERDGQRQGENFFDKETHLIVATKKELPDNQTGKVGEAATYYSGYQKVDGLNLPMCIVATKDGAPFFTIKVVEVTFLKKIGDDEFAKPGAQP
jgi:hypothetical protein